MNQIEIFNSPEFGSIRTLEQNGKVLFCGTDVATALGYTNPRKAVRDHTRGGTKCSIGVQTGKKADGSPAVQMVEMLFIPEGDLYRLIAHSKLPSAERFEQWVFDEVLPAIRKHGAYLTKEKLWEIATSPEALIKLCSELLAEREENASLREENALLESKAGQNTKRQHPKRVRKGRFDMGNFTFEEMNLMCIYNTGSRTGLIDSLREMRGELSPEETELRELTDSALGKLQAMSDAEFAELELYPDFDQ